MQPVDTIEVVRNALSNAHTSIHGGGPGGGMPVPPHANRSGPPSGGRGGGGRGPVPGRGVNGVGPAPGPGRGVPLGRGGAGRGPPPGQQGGYAPQQYRG